MDRAFPFTTWMIDLFRVPSLVNLKRVTSKSLVAAALLVGLLSGSKARADSFFDIFVELWDSGQVVMEPVESGAFPFPPPPLDFPNLPVAGGAIDIEMVSLSLQSSQPMDVSPPEPTGSFTVDSFFDITYDITSTNGNVPSTHTVDSFFDIAYRMQVTPGPTEILPRGEESRTFDIEMLSMDLTKSRPIDLTGDPDFDLAIQLVEGFDPGLDGHVTVLKLAGGGGYIVDSFFDIFVEISVDGGATLNSSTQGQLRLLSHATVPEPATCGMLAFALVAALFARRRGDS